MASPFKIPKKKQPPGCDSAPLHTSPLSRLQSPAQEFKQGYGDQASGGGADRMHAGNLRGSSLNRQSAPLFRVVVKTLLGLNSPGRGAAAANQRAASAANRRGGWSRHSQAGQRAEPPSDGWRPKRASDRLLQPDVASERRSPPQKKKRDLSGPSATSVSVQSLDTLAELRGEVHAGSLARRTAEPGPDAAEGKHSDQTSEDDLLSPSRNRRSVTSPKTPAVRGQSLDPAVRGQSLDPAVRGQSLDRAGKGRTLDRAAWLSAGSDLRKREEKFRGRKMMKKPRQTEPIVLSSEEEEEQQEQEEEEEEEKEKEKEKEKGTDGGQRGEEPELIQNQQDQYNPPPPSFLQLDFTSLHTGLTHADANGKMMITENGISIPLRGAEEGEVTVVASQVRRYGVWDGGVAQDSALLAGWKGPAPSLLFLWVTDAQANLLQRELSTIQTSVQTCTPTPGLPCSFLLLVLKEQLQELQAALLASILDMEEYRRASSSSGGPTSPLEWTDGLLLLHSCPPPLVQHLLGLLGQSTTRNNQKNKKSNLNSSGLQQLPSRLIQYPTAPCKGRITVMKEDLACLGDGEFLNDVIIDFYLKYLLLEGVGGPVAERSHVFSSFFYKQLSRRRAAGEDDAPSVPDRHTRHQRVKTWTRHVDIFNKDFLFVPINQEAHWYLVVVCFPGLEKVQYQEVQSPAGGAERAAGNPSSFSLKSQQPPTCTQQSWRRDTVLKRPCILVLDSLKLSDHQNVCRLLRDYLQVEWQVRRGTPRLITADSMKSSRCRVPQQDNSSDCGLYLLQYAESFLQNPVVHFELPIQLDNWFPRQRVRQKREAIRALIMRMHQSQSGGT